LEDSPVAAVRRAAGALRCDPVRRRRRSITLPPRTTAPSPESGSSPVRQPLPPATGVRVHRARTHVHPLARARAHYYRYLSAADGYGGDDKVAAAASDGVYHLHNNNTNHYNDTRRCRRYAHAIVVDAASGEINS